MESLKFVMTTTFYPPYHLGGDAVHVYQLSNELAKLGHKVHIIHSIDSYKWQRKGEPAHQYPNHENITVHSIKSPLGKLTPLISYVIGVPYPIQKEIKDIINEIKPDVLHHHNIAGFGPFLLRIKAPTVLYTAHDYWSVCPMNGLTKYDRSYCTSKSNCLMCSIRSKRPPQFWRNIGLMYKYLQNVDAIITPSSYMKNKLAGFGLKGNFITIPNFVPKLSDTGEAICTHPYFLFVGVIEEHKGIRNLIHSFIDSKSDMNVKLLVVGSGSLENEMKEIITKNGYDDQIMMLGRIDDLKLANLYTHALAVIIPSIWPENCPLVALEALNHATPIITSDEGGLPEIVKTSDAGIVFKDNKLSTIIRNYNSKDKLKFLTENAFESSKTNYTFDDFYKKYLSLIK